MKDPMLRAAVERQFEIVGEALVRLANRDAAVAARIGEHQHIIAFRNILVGLDSDHASRKLDLSKVETIALPPASAAE